MSEGASCVKIGLEAWATIAKEVFSEDTCPDFEKLKSSIPRLDSVLAAMEPREAMALKCRYEEKLTMKQIGEKIGRIDGSGPCTQDRAGQIVARAIRRLRLKRNLGNDEVRTAIWGDLDAR